MGRVGTLVGWDAGMVMLLRLGQDWTGQRAQVIVLADLILSFQCGVKFDLKILLVFFSNRICKTK